MVATFATQIEIDAQGIAWIGGTRVKVVEVVLDKIAHGWSAEEIHFQHPHLSLAQIHAALTYYYENQDICDRQIGASRHHALTLSTELGDAGLRAKLRGLHPSL